MKKFFKTAYAVYFGFVVTLGLLCYFFPPTMGRKSDSEEMRNIQNIYARQNQGFVEKNVDKALSNVSPLCIFIGPHGEKSTLFLMRQSLHELFPQSSHASTWEKVTSFKLQHDIATVTVSEVTTMDVVNSRYNYYRDKRDTLKMVGTNEDRWLRIPGGWSLISSRQTSETDTVDGQAITE